MINWCFVCSPDLEGNHESDCPLNPNNRVFFLNKDEAIKNRLNNKIGKFVSSAHLDSIKADK